MSEKKEPKFPVGMTVYNQGDLKKEKPYELVAYIGDDSGNAGSEEWWAIGPQVLDTISGLCRISVGVYWKPEAEKNISRYASGDQIVNMRKKIEKHEQVLEAVRLVNNKLWKSLRSLGKQKQFPDRLCWCDTLDGNYCVGQPQCKDAQEALELNAKLVEALNPEKKDEKSS